MEWLEPTAVAFGLVSVWLSTRQHIASWPTALVNVSLYFVIFQRGRLYANMGLQVFFFLLSCYGWYEWKYGGANRTELPVSRTTRSQAMILAPIGVASAALLTWVLARYTDAELPLVDSATTALSLVAQWMMTRKLLECWILWTVVNVVSIGMLLYTGLYVAAIQYAGFLVLAIMGFFEWRRSLRVTVA